MLFDTLHGLARVLVLGVSGYASLVVLLRISGKRTLAKLNAFDLVVTVALGSTLATVVLSSDVALAEGILALVTLVGAQFVLAYFAARSGRTASAVKAKAVVVVWHGELLHDELRRERIAPEEIRQALRQHGIPSVDGAAAVVLESDGSLSVLRSVVDGPSSVLVGVRNPSAAPS
jgi:uncharacterized membrane protein YcaP (DUF421 family)